MTALDEQVGGSHYKDMVIQPWIFNTLNKIPATEAHIIEYISRWRKKGGVQDLEKIKQFCQLLIEQEEKIEEVKKLVNCENCFNKHLLAHTLEFGLVFCKCECHEKTCEDCGHDSVNFKETYKIICQCNCHKKTNNIVECHDLPDKHRSDCVPFNCKCHKEAKYVK